MTIKVKISQQQSQTIPVKITTNGGLAQVAHDDTLVGLGTSVEPLGINPEYTQEITDKIDTVADALAGETTKREQSDALLQEAIKNNTENIGNNTSAINALNSNLNAEITARERGDMQINEKINAFPDYVLNPTEEQRDAINSGINSDKIAGYDASISALNSGLQAEQTARADADTTLQDNIDSEASTRASEDSKLATGLSDETSARENADAVLQTNIDNEVARATIAENALGTRITDEATARSNADNALQNNIDAEESARKSADNALQDGIDKNAADILAETTNRTSADNALDAKITATNKSLSDTKSALEAVDTGLQEQIDTINGKIPTQATATNQLADKDFVNSSINNMAAFYITSNADGDAFATKTALLAGPWYSQGAKRNPTINDYAIVLSDESKDSACTRYMYDGAQWDFQYVVNDTPMTAAQVAAINSTITKDLVDTYNAHVANSTIHVTQADKDAWNAKQDALTTTQLNATNSGITSTKVASYDAHIANKSNPHSVTATQIGLGNVDNTSDADKPISTATQTALDGKVSKSGDTMSGDLIFGKNSSLYLSAIGSTVANTTSRLNLGTPDKVYSYLTGNSQGAFGIYSEISGTRKGIACYPSSNFFADATTKTIDLGRSNNVWKTLYADTLSDGSTSAATATVISGAAAGATAVQPADLATVATTGSYNDLGDKPTIGDATLTITRNNESAGTFTANATANKTINIAVPVSASDVNALPDSTKYGTSFTLTMDSTTYKISASLKDQDGNILGAVQTIDLPLESVVVSGAYDATTKEVVLTLEDGSEIRFSVADLVDGLQTEITETNKLSADLVNDSTSVNKFVTSAEKNTWNNKQDAISDLATIRSGASKGATAVQPASLSAVATSGSYNDLSNKPTIPTTLAGLTGDVSISSPAQGQHLVYDGSKWKNTASTASISWGDITGTLSNQSDLQTALNAKQNTLTTAQQNAVNSGITSTKVSSYDTHIANKSNPHAVTKAQVGLGNVDNTSDANKPISTATQTALDTKQAKGNYVTTDTTQTVTGVKTFQQGSDTALVKVQNSTATLGTTPTAEKTTQVRFDDKNGDWIGLVSGKVETDGSTSVELCVRAPNKSGSGFISVDSDASGNISLNASDGAKNSVKSWASIVGQIITYAGTTAPSGYLACDGAAISRTTYANLFAVIGTTYGEGDGSTTFNLPDFQGARFVNSADIKNPTVYVGKVGNGNTRIGAHYGNDAGAISGTYEIIVTTYGGHPAYVRNGVDATAGNDYDTQTYIKSENQLSVAPEMLVCIKY